MSNSATQYVCYTPQTHIASVSKHLRGKKNGGWMRPPTWKLDFIHLPIRIDYASPSQPVPTTKILK